MARTQAQRLQDRAYIAGLLSRCPHYTTEQIRDELAKERAYEVTMQAVNGDIKQLSASWKEAGVRDFDELRGKELHEIDTVQAFCYAVFFGEASETEITKFLGKSLPKQRSESVVRSFDYILDDNNELVPRPTGFQTKVEQLRGNAEFLRACLLDCSRERRALLGLDAPKRNEISGVNGGAIELTGDLQNLIDKAYSERNNQ